MPRPERHKGGGRHRCPRCNVIGDPRMCNCMKRLRRYVAEARRHQKEGRPLQVRANLANADKMLEDLALDAGKARSGRGKR